MSHPQLEPGYLMTRIGPGGLIEIVQADPVVECTEQYLRAVTQTPTGQLGPHTGPSLTMVTFVGSNRSVTYLIGEFDEEREVYTLRWPD